MQKQSRKWLVTINNYEEKGFTVEKVKGILDSFFASNKSDTYYCLSCEVGLKEGTPHIHICIYRSTAIRFNTIKNLFASTAHIDPCRGTVKQTRDYVFKEGKWRDDPKEDSRVDGTQYESGEVPEEKQGKRTDLDYLYDLIKDGLTIKEILDINPSFIKYLPYIEKVYYELKQEEYKNTWRDLEVTYIFGTSGAGKTRGVMEEYGYENVYRVTDYAHPFDGYKYQDIIVFEEFRSSLKIDHMLNYLDGYPLELPCRYNNKIACFTKVYIITNYSITEQYTNVQAEHEETWRAFLRRIHNIIQYTSDNVRKFTCEEYFNKIEYNSGEDFQGCVDWEDLESFIESFLDDIDDEDSSCE